jgi:hypothetical protein
MPKSESTLWHYSPQLNISRARRPSAGRTRFSHLRENIGAIDVQLTPADVSEIETGISRLEIYGGRMDARQMAQIGQDA